MDPVVDGLSGDGVLIDRFVHMKYSFITVSINQLEGPDNLKIVDK